MSGLGLTVPRVSIPRRFQPPYMMVGTTRSVIAETSRASLESNIDPPPCCTVLTWHQRPTSYSCDFRQPETDVRSLHAPTISDLAASGSRTVPAHDRSRRGLLRHPEPA